MLADVLDSTGVITAAGTAGVRNPLNRARRVRAVLFDVDGTLYRQQPVRLRMAAELGRSAITQPFKTRTIVRVLSEYRKAQETLRASAEERGAFRQAEVAAERSRIAVARVREIVSEWMIDRPLRHLPACRASGLLELLSFLAARAVPAGVLSDYPAEHKLGALGIADRFALVLCATDSEVGTFKPHPRGFLAAAERWQLDPSDILFVGDRVDVDAAGARAAGMPCVILTRTSIANTAECLAVPTFERLRDVLDDNH